MAPTKNDGVGFLQHVNFQARIAADERCPRRRTPLRAARVVDEEQVLEDDVREGLEADPEEEDAEAEGALEEDEEAELDARRPRTQVARLEVVLERAAALHDVEEDGAEAQDDEEHEDLELQLVVL